MNQAEGQKSWGWMVIWYIFLAGLGGGTFVFSFVLNLLGKFQSVAQIGCLIGPVLVLAGTLMLLFDLGNPLRSYRLFTTSSTLGSSWMIRGAWILLAFIVLGLLYALPSFDWFRWLPWDNTTATGMVLGWIAGLLAVFVTVYPGLLLGVIRSIPLWNTAALPPLFFLSGLDTGMAALVLLSLAFPAAIGADAFHLLGAIDIVLIILVLIVLGTYIEILRQSGLAAAQSVRLLNNPLFIGGVVIAGLVLPLCILVAGIFVQDVQALRVMDGIAGVLILFGGLLLRFNVVKSGVRIVAG
jgi:formate-dependent nitrite reductase membrane component NrfD